MLRGILQPSEIPVLNSCLWYADRNLNCRNGGVVSQHDVYVCASLMKASTTVIRPCDRMRHGHYDYGTVPEYLRHDNEACGVATVPHC